MIARRSFLFSVATCAVASVLLVAAFGCVQYNALKYKIVGPDEIPAKYIPAKESMAIFVENYRNPSESYLDSERLTPYIAKALADNNVAPIVDPVEMYNLRDRKTAEIRKMSIAQIGRELNAKQVLYVDLISSSIDLASGSDSYKGTVTLRVRIIDTTTGETRWPEQAADGYPVSVETPVIRSAEGVNENTVLDMTFRSAADEVARLFYNFKPAT